MPTTMTIYPYLFEDTCWVFDDERTGLKEEAFVLGMTEMISKLVEYKLIPNASQGFSMTFAAEPFDHDIELKWISPAEVAKDFNCTLNELPGDGNWYRGMVAGEEMVLPSSSRSCSMKIRTRRFSKHESIKAEKVFMIAPISTLIDYRLQ